MGYLPVLLLGAHERTIVLLNVVISAFGITQHANIRIAHAALARRHPLHARPAPPAPRARERARVHNYGTTVAIWDRLFGTFHPARRDGPDDIGIEGDQVPRTFWKQVLEPFKGQNRRMRRLAAFGDRTEHGCARGVPA